MEKIQYFQAQFKTIPKEESKGEAKDSNFGTVIKGYASTPTKDRYDDIVEPNAFKESIQKNYRKNPIILFQHKTDRPIGKATHTSIDKKGLYLEALIVDNEVEPKIHADILKTFSIGYIPKKTEYQDKDGNVLDANDKNDLHRIWFEAGIVRIIKELELVENSIVSVPANPDALFSLSKSVKAYFEDKAEIYKKTHNQNAMDKPKEKNLLDVKEVDEEPKEEVEKTEEVEKEEEEPKEETPKEEVEKDISKVADVEKDKSDKDVEKDVAEKSEKVEKEEPKEFADFSKEDKEILEKIATPKGAVVAFKAIGVLEGKVAELTEVVEKTPAKKAMAYMESSIKETKKVGVSENAEVKDEKKKGFKEALEGATL